MNEQINQMMEAIMPMMVMVMTMGMVGPVMLQASKSADEELEQDLRSLSSERLRQIRSGLGTLTDIPPSLEEYRETPIKMIDRILSERRE